MASWSEESIIEEFDASAFAGHDFEVDDIEALAETNRVPVLSSDAESHFGESQHAMR